MKKTDGETGLCYTKRSPRRRFERVVLQFRVLETAETTGQLRFGLWILLAPSTPCTACSSRAITGLGHCHWWPDQGKVFTTHSSFYGAKLASAVDRQEIRPRIGRISRKIRGGRKEIEPQRGVSGAEKISPRKVPSSNSHFLDAHREVGDVSDNVSGRHVRFYHFQWASALLRVVKILPAHIAVD